GKIHSQRNFPCDTRDARGNHPDPSISPFSSNSANHIAICQQLEHARQIGRIILEIAVQCGDDRAMTCFKPSPKRGALTSVASVAESSHTPVRAGDFCYTLPCIILTRIINQDQFESGRRVAKSVKNLLRGRLDHISGRIAHCNCARVLLRCPRRFRKTHWTCSVCCTSGEYLICSSAGLPCSRMSRVGIRRMWIC